MLTREALERGVQPLEHRLRRAVEPQLAAGAPLDLTSPHQGADRVRGHDAL